MDSLKSDAKSRRDAGYVELTVVEDGKTDFFASFPKFTLNVLPERSGEICETK